MIESSIKIKKHYKNQYTTIDNILINDMSISFKAKGVFLYFWSKPDDWEIKPKAISNDWIDKQTVIYTALKELEDSGYLYRKRFYINGKIAGINYHLSDIKKFNQELLNQENLNQGNQDEYIYKQNKENNKIKKEQKNNIKKENSNCDNLSRLDIKKENVFVEPTNDYYSTTDIVDNTPKYTNQTAGQKNIILTENQYQNIDNSTKNSWPQNDITILETNTHEVVVERNKQYLQDDIVDRQPMVQQAYCDAGIAVFNDGQFGFGSLLNKDADLWLKSDILMELRNHNKNSQNDIITICKEKQIKYQQLYNVFYDTMYKKKQTILDTKTLLTLNYFIKVLQSFNQLTYSKNDNTIQRNSNISGSNQQEQSGSTERYITAGTTKKYGTGKEGLEGYLADNVAGYKR